MTEDLLIFSIEIITFRNSNKNCCSDCVTEYTFKLSADAETHIVSFLGAICHGYPEPRFGLHESPQHVRDLPILLESLPNVFHTAIVGPMRGQLVRTPLNPWDGNI